MLALFFSCSPWWWSLNLLTLLKSMLVWHSTKAGHRCLKVQVSQTIYYFHLLYNFKNLVIINWLFPRNVITFYFTVPEDCISSLKPSFYSSHSIYYVAYFTPQLLPNPFIPPICITASHVQECTHSLSQDFLILNLFSIIIRLIMLI